MAGSRHGATDDFASDDVAEASKIRHVDSTRQASYEAGLEETDGKGEMLFHPIVTSLFEVGRSADCNLVIRDDTKVSRRHACITREEMGYAIEDLNSSNGTFINGKRLKGKTSLKVADTITIGKRTFTFVLRTH